MKKALLIGNYVDVQWHPLTGVDDEIKRILDDFDTEITENYSVLEIADLLKYDLIINYADTLETQATPDFAGALLGYVAGGRGLLTIHNGIIAQSIPEIEQLIGASFTDHPPHEVIEYVPVNDHPIMENVGSFSIDEEPYQFEMDNLARVTLILEYIYKGESYPAAWVRRYGKGRSCYLQPGHNKATFTNEGFRSLLRNAALWCIGDI